jgi:hypothetical protein
LQEGRSRKKRKSLMTKQMMLKGILKLKVKLKL